MGQVYVSRQDLADVRGMSIEGIWEATRKGFWVENKDYTYSQRVFKYDHDWKQAWARLRQMSDMSEDEFAAECQVD